MGEGAQARIYAATHLIIKRPVAVKILRRFSDDLVVSRFMNEGRAAGSIGHPNIVESLDMGFATDGAPYLVMELLHGKTLADEIVKQERIGVGRAAHIGQQIASALAAAHAQGIVHRDLKSENVFLVQRDGRPDHVKVIDFGISKFVDSRLSQADVGKAQVVGTADFMPPEQVTDPLNIDERVDVYALGVILYDMLAGVPPFADEKDMADVFQAIVHKQPKSIRSIRSDVSAEFAGIVARAMHKDPAERFQSMLDLEAALTAFAVEPNAPRRTHTATDSESIRATVPGLESGQLAAPRVPQDLSGQMISRTRMKRNARSLGFRKTRRPYGLGIAMLAFGALLFLFSRGAPKQGPVAPAAAPASNAITFAVQVDAEGARMRLRGADYALPYEGQIVAGPEPELVEITAPGREGRRYWISFDRPRRLGAALPEGSGATEATFAETEAALGESIPR